LSLLRNFKRSYHLCLSELSENFEFSIGLGRREVNQLPAASTRVDPFPN
jgi:hypothetical protein